MVLPASQRSPFGATAMSLDDRLARRCSNAYRAPSRSVILRPVDIVRAGTRKPKVAVRCDCNPDDERLSGRCSNARRAPSRSVILRPVDIVRGGTYKPKIAIRCDCNPGDDRLAERRCSNAYRAPSRSVILRPVDIVRGATYKPKIASSHASPPRGAGPGVTGPGRQAAHRASRQAVMPFRSMVPELTVNVPPAATTTVASISIFPTQLPPS